jgi:hypothetical protein
MEKNWSEHSATEATENAWRKIDHIFRCRVTSQDGEQGSSRNEGLKQCGSYAQIPPTFEVLCPYLV